MTHPHLMINPEGIMNFILGGNATFTLKSKKTEKRFTYKVYAPKNRNKDNTNYFYVKLLNGSDNESSYTYIGYLKKQPEFNNWVFVYGEGKAKVSFNAPSVQAFDWTFKRYSAMQECPMVEFWHSGRCCRCGRKLTDPSSIAIGIGPECASIKLNAK